MPSNMEAFTRFIKVIKDDTEKRFLLSKSSDLNDLVVGQYTASKLIDIFSRNELAANKILKGHYIRVTTVAEEIGEDFRKKAYIRAVGKNEFASINLYVDGSDDTFLKMGRGDKVDLVCSDVRYVMHTPFLEGCITSKEFADKNINKIINIPDDFNKNYEINSSGNFLTFLILYKANEKKLEKSCIISDKNCVRTIANIINNKKFDPEKDFIELSKKNKDDVIAIMNIFKGDS